MEQAQPVHCAYHPIHARVSPASGPPLTADGLPSRPSLPPLSPSHQQGWKDPALTEVGEAEALAGAKALKKHGADHFDVAYTSVLQRANKTLDIILNEIGQTGLETIKDQALNERDYGDLTGLNKDDG